MGVQVTRFAPGDELSLTVAHPAETASTSDAVRRVITIAGLSGQ